MTKADNQEQVLIKTLALAPHPEGGYYRETYRAGIDMAGKNLPEVFGGRRQSATSILFLLSSSDFSAFHKLNQDEVWYFHQGGLLILHLIHEDGTYEELKLGLPHNNGQPQCIIPAKTLFAAETKGEYCLVGCMTSPGFDFADLVMPSRKTIMEQHPQHETLIKKFTRT